MNARRWWDLIVACSLGVLAMIALVGNVHRPLDAAGAVLTLAAIGLAYARWGRPVICPDAAAAGTDRVGPGQTLGLLSRRLGSASLLRVFLIVACAVATSFDPRMATLQALLFPMIWTLTERFSASVALSAALAAATALGLWASTGRDIDAAVQAGATQAVSLAFALAMGTWITRIADAGNTQRLLVQQLTDAQDDLAAAHRDAGSAIERERLAREIHDTIAQSLTSVVMLAQRVRRELDSLPADTSTAADTVDLIEATGRDALTEARALVASMSPVRAGDGDLAHTVVRLAERFERETGIRVQVRVTGLDSAEEPLDRALEVVVLRCAQEGLANVRKHSRAGAAAVEIERAGEEIILTVCDDGQGLGSYRPDTETGFGLAGMRDRVALVGGRLEVVDGADDTAGRPGPRHEPKRGTTLRVTLPVAAPAPALQPGGRG